MDGHRAARYRRRALPRRGAHQLLARHLALGRRLHEHAGRPRGAPRRRRHVPAAAHLRRRSVRRQHGRQSGVAARDVEADGLDHGRRRGHRRVRRRGLPEVGGDEPTVPRPRQELAQLCGARRHARTGQLVVLRRLHLEVAERHAIRDEHDREHDAPRDWHQRRRHRCRLRAASTAATSPVAAAANASSGSGIATATATAATSTAAISLATATPLAAASAVHGALAACGATAAVAAAAVALTAASQSSQPAWNVRIGQPRRPHGRDARRRVVLCGDVRFGSTRPLHRGLHDGRNTRNTAMRDVVRHEHPQYRLVCQSLLGRISLLRFCRERVPPIWGRVSLSHLRQQNRINRLLLHGCLPHHDGW